MPDGPELSAFTSTDHVSVQSAIMPLASSTGPPPRVLQVSATLPRCGCECRPLARRDLDSAVHEGRGDHEDSEGLGLNVPLGPSAGAEAVIE